MGLVQLTKTALAKKAGQFAVAALLGSSALASPAFGQSLSPEEIRQLREEIRTLQAEQIARAAEMQRSNERLNALANMLDRAEGIAPAPTNTGPLQSASAAAPVSAKAATLVPSENPVQLSGDIRLRYESNFGDATARNRDRGVLRARLRASYKVSDWLGFGGQIVTGDPDDPNSADISLSNFNDDLDVSLDQAYVRLNFGNLQLLGGKMPQPFARTELVWDGDVSPQGVAATYKRPLGGLGNLKVTGLYFLVDESVAGPNSDMIGGQVGLDVPVGDNASIELAGAYYDYALQSLAGSDAGDIRSNLLAGDGTYLSDFDLIDGIVAFNYRGFGDHWPLRIVGNYVKNLGAATSADTGYGVDVLVGRTKDKGDWRIGYGYAVVETDAVLAAFSQDNTTIGTNYRQHMLSLDYVLWSDVLLNTTLYRYSSKSGPTMDDWRNRLRVNFVVNF